MMQALSKHIPALGWLGTYKREYFKGDLSAGLIVAVMLIPQGMAYALLAGIDPIYGLYAVTLPLFIYALFGSSRHLAVGPVAMVSLLVFTGVSALAEPGTPEYFSYVLLLTLMIGMIQLAMGLMRMGFLVNFLSHAVISGFTSAAAIVIGLSQLKHLLGVNLATPDYTHQLLVEAFSRLNEVNGISLAIGLGSIALMVAVKRWKLIPIPGSMLVVVFSILAVYGLGLADRGVKIVGHVPSGLPGFSLPSISLESFQLLLPMALMISFIAYMESIAVAKAIAKKEKYKIESNQELKGLGLANLVAAFFSSMPVTGGFSRTAVNYQSGAKTGLASMISAALIVVTLLFLTPLFYYLPTAVLAAIIMVAVASLIDIKEFKHLLHIKKTDGLLLAVTFLLTLFVGIETGIFAGMGLSLGLFIWRSAYPHSAELGYLAKEGVYRNVQRFPEAKTFEGVLILRVDESLYFANMAFLEDKIESLLNNKPEVKKVILEMSGVNDMDAVAVEQMESFIRDYEKQGIEFHFAAMKGPVRDLVARAHWPEKFGSKVQHMSLDRALNSIYREDKSSNAVKEGAPA